MLLMLLHDVAMILQTPISGVKGIGAVTRSAPGFHGMGALAVEIAPHMLETCRLFHEGLAATGACKGGKQAIGCRCRDGGHIGTCHSFFVVAPRE